MTNKEIAKILKSTAAMIDLTGGNPYRSRAMANAARNIERTEESLVSLSAESRLTSIRGIGEGLAEQITEIIETGTFQTREDLVGAIPAGLMEILRIKGLGAIKVRTLWQKLGITTIKELEEMATSGRLASVEGFAEKTQENVLQNIQLLKKYITRRRYADLFQLMEPALEKLLGMPEVSRASFSGELRRKLETVGLAELVVSTSDRAACIDAIGDWLDETGKMDETGGIFRGAVADGIPFEIVFAEEGAFDKTLWKRTGSAAHVEAFAARFGEPENGVSEDGIYAGAGLAPIPPELREGNDELERASKSDLPALIKLEDLKGTLHNHSTYSDGAHTLRQMVDAAFEMGLSYFGICDHSQSLVVAHGLTPDRVADQQVEIRNINEEFAARGGRPFKVFSGIESDILNDGSLDYADDVLASFDFIVASVHTRLNMSKEEATDRVLTAVQNPYTSILGHPTGRILLVREGYPLDYDIIMEACATHNVAVELNANPYRLDLDWRHVRKAIDMGILISINPDAHSIDGLHDMRWGTEAARKGWLTPAQCLNVMPLDAFEDWLSEQKSKR